MSLPRTALRGVFLLLALGATAVASVWFLVGGPYVTAVELQGTTAPVTVRWLGNAGVWIESGTNVVVIDGLYDGTISGESYRYSNLGERDAEDARAGRGRWREVDLVLATHRHFDHFEASVVAAHLRANPSAEFAGPHQAVDLLRSESSEITPRAHSFQPSSEGTGRLKMGEIGVTFLDLPHGDVWRGSIENVGLVVEVDGVRILHVGDAAADLRLYDTLRDEIGDVDLFLVPVWYLWEPAGNEVIRRLVSAARAVGVHVTPERSRWIEWNLRIRWPGVDLMERW